MSRPPRIPQPHALIVEESKIVAYLLNPQHKEGASKAKFFCNRGFTAGEWQKLAGALRTHGATREVTATEQTAFGLKYIVECAIATPDKSDPCVLTVWIQKGKLPPRLVTAHPNRG